MPTVHFKKLYKYEKIYGNIYIVRLNNRQIIYIRNTRFHKKDPFVKRVDEEILLEVVFDKETKRLVFKEVIFGSNNKLLLFRILRSLQFQQTEISVIGEISTEEQSIYPPFF